MKKALVFLSLTLILGFFSGCSSNDVGSSDTSTNDVYTPTTNNDNQDATTDPVIPEGQGNVKLNIIWPTQSNKVQSLSNQDAQKSIPVGTQSMAIMFHSTEGNPTFQYRPQFTQIINRSGTGASLVSVNLPATDYKIYLTCMDQINGGGYVIGVGGLKDVQKISITVGQTTNASLNVIPLQDLVIRTEYSLSPTFDSLDLKNFKVGNTVYARFIRNPLIDTTLLDGVTGLLFWISRYDPVTQTWVTIPDSLNVSGIHLNNPPNTTEIKGLTSIIQIQLVMGFYNYGFQNRNPKTIVLTPVPLNGSSNLTIQ